MKRLLLLLLALSAVATQAATLTLQLSPENPGSSTNWVYWISWTNSVSTNKLPSSSSTVAFQNMQALFPVDHASLIFVTISNVNPGAISGYAAVESPPRIFYIEPLPLLIPNAPTGTVTISTPVSTRRRP